MRIPLLHDWKPKPSRGSSLMSSDMQSLALDVNVVSEEGARAEVRDDDDDLLRAAEELGIDLSGVRAEQPSGNGASDEATESEETVETLEADAADAGDAPDPVDLEAAIDLGDDA